MSFRQPTSITPANGAHAIQEAIETAINLVYLARASQTLDEVDGYLGNAEEQLKMVAVLVGRISGMRPM